MAYKIINSMKELKDFMKGKRKRQMVIFSDEFLKKNKVICAYCGKKIKPKEGNRVHVYPKEKKLFLCTINVRGTVFLT